MTWLQHALPHEVKAHEKHNKKIHGLKKLILKEQTDKLRIYDRVKKRRQRG